MRIKDFPGQLLLVPLIVFLPIQSFAYNFLYIHPTTGQPIGWEPGITIQYYLDPGSLGRLTNEQAHTLVKEAIKVWENDSSQANIPKFEFAGYLSEDVNGTNYEKYVSLGQCYTDDLESCPTEAQKNLQTVIIFDEDDSILDNELCRISSCAASAGARVFSGNSTNPRNIVQAIFVLGGFTTDENTKVSAVVGLMVHELGHLLGLAHSSVNQEVFLEGLTSFVQHMPSMFFNKLGLTSNKTEVTLNPDDIAGISVLYPSDTFAAETATIKGQILKSDGSPMGYVNIIARNNEDPLCEAYSFLGGRICSEGTHTSGSLSGGTCFDEDGNIVPTSDFVISGLPSGSYTLEVEEIASNDIQLTLAPGFANAFIYGDAEFWNEGDTASEDHLTSSVITLASGETRENVDIILNRSEVTEDRIKYIPFDTFTAGPGTQCPEEPPIDYAALIGIEETDSGTSDTTDPSPSAGGCSLMQAAHVDLADFGVGVGNDSLK